MPFGCPPGAKLLGGMAQMLRQVYQKHTHKRTNAHIFALVIRSRKAPWRAATRKRKEPACLLIVFFSIKCNFLFSSDGIGFVYVSVILFNIYVTTVSCLTSA